MRPTPFVTYVLRPHKIAAKPTHVARYDAKALPTLRRGTRPARGALRSSVVPACSQNCVEARNALGWFSSVPSPFFNLTFGCGMAPGPTGEHNDAKSDRVC